MNVVEELKKLQELERRYYKQIGLFGFLVVSIAFFIQGWGQIDLAAQTACFLISLLSFTFLILDLLDYKRRKM